MMNDQFNKAGNSPTVTLPADEYEKLILQKDYLRARLLEEDTAFWESIDLQKLIANPKPDIADIIADIEKDLANERR